MAFEALLGAITERTRRWLNGHEYGSPFAQWADRDALYLGDRLVELAELVRGRGQIVQFTGSGQLQVADNVGMWWWNRTDRTLVITDVTLWREVEGLSGDTVVDVEVDPTGAGGAFASVYLPGDRPSVSAGSSPAVARANTFASTSVAPGAAVRVNVVQVETGNPANVAVQITLR